MKKFYTVVILFLLTPFGVFLYDYNPYIAYTILACYGAVLGLLVLAILALLNSPNPEEFSENVEADEFASNSDNKFLPYVPNLEAFNSLGVKWSERPLSIGEQLSIHLMQSEDKIESVAATLSFLASRNEGSYVNFSTFNPSIFDSILKDALVAAGVPIEEDFSNIDLDLE